MTPAVMTVGELRRLLQPLEDAAAVCLIYDGMLTAARGDWVQDDVAEALHEPWEPRPTPTPGLVLVDERFAYD